MLPMKAVSDYLTTTFTQTQGWCWPHLWQVIQPLSDFQTTNGISNPVAEIGVYHGKFFIGLMKTRPAKMHYAIDAFGRSSFNLDRAGDGDLEIFKSNVVKSGEDIDSVVCLQCDSTAITRSDIEGIRSITGGFSMFSVDGCHMAEHTVNDLRIAMDLTIPHGIIFVDDYYNADWPGVQEGVTKLYLNETPCFVPLAYCLNKLFLCHISCHAMLLKSLHEFVKRHFPETRMKSTRRFGYDCVNLHPNPKSHKYLALES